MLTIIILSTCCAFGGSLIGALVAVFGRSNSANMRVGNASGIGFLAGASVGALIGIFETMMGRL